MGDRKAAQDTEVVLVVKGAGLHKAGDTLDLFLQGFWPAVTSVDPKATVTQRSDVFPSDFCSSPGDKDFHRQVVEITARHGKQKKRIWVRESYWEAELKPENPLRVLSNEWHMASYAFGSMLLDWLSNFHTIERRGKRLKRRFHLFAYFLMYLSVLLPALVLAYWNEAIRPLSDALLLGGGLAVLLSLIAAVRPAAAALHFNQAESDGERRQLPGMGTWILMPMLAAFVINPGGYLLLLLILGAVELVILYARHFAWPYRTLANSDTDTLYYYIFDDEGKKRFGRRHAKSTKISQLIYRYIVVLGLPPTFPIVLLAKLLKLIPVTPVTKSISTAVDNVLNLVLSSVLGDVVSYAMNPAQAHRVRSVIAEELKFFHDCPEVSGIHVFAHSQGTPITFESLFRHLPKPYREKVKTYVTIGSVLSFYKQANPVLDKVYHSRFPGFPYPDDFHKDFRWINCWNLYDPITEFFALDEYTMATDAPHIKEISKEPGRIAPDLDEQGLIESVKRHRASPRNVRTMGTSLVWKSHFEYWTNLDEVQIPFAQRVLGELRPQGWNTALGLKRAPSRSYGFRLLLSVVGVVLLAAIAGVSLYFLWRVFLAKWVAWLGRELFTPAVQRLFEIFGISTDQMAGEESIVTVVRNALSNSVAWWRTKEAGRLREFLVDVIVALTLAASALSSIVETLAEGRRRQIRAAMVEKR